MKRFASNIFSACFGYLNLLRPVSNSSADIPVVASFKRLEAHFGIDNNPAERIKSVSNCNIFKGFSKHSVSQIVHFCWVSCQLKRYQSLDLDLILMTLFHNLLYSPYNPYLRIVLKFLSGMCLIKAAINSFASIQSLFFCIRPLIMITKHHDITVVHDNTVQCDRPAFHVALIYCRIF